MSAYEFLSAALAFIQGVGWGGMVLAVGVLFVIGFFLRQLNKS